MMDLYGCLIIFGVLGLSFALGAILFKVIGEPIIRPQKRWWRKGNGRV